MLDWFIGWIQDDLLQQNAPKLAGAIVALAAAHSSVLAKWGISVDWSTFGGKVTTVVVLLVGMLGGHHTAKAVTPTPPPSA
jgi:hypothetical protein